MPTLWVRVKEVNDHILDLPKGDPTWGAVIYGFPDAAKISKAKTDIEGVTVSTLAEQLVSRILHLLCLQRCGQAQH
jgi:hypothetical protein